MDLKLEKIGRHLYIVANPLISLFLVKINGGNIFKMRSLKPLVKYLAGNNLNDINISASASLMTMALRRVIDGFVGDFLFSQLVENDKLQIRALTKLYMVGIVCTMLLLVSFFLNTNNFDVSFIHCIWLLLVGRDSNPIAAQQMQQ